MSTQAAAQLADLQALLIDRHINPNTNDIWTYSWGTNFHARKAYKEMVGTLDASPLFAWLWSSSNLGKHKFF